MTIVCRQCGATNVRHGAYYCSTSCKVKGHTYRVPWRGETFTSKELAELAGVHLATILNRFKNGKDPVTGK